MTYTQIEIQITNQAQSEILIALLANIGFEGFEEKENTLQAFIKKEVQEIKQLQKSKLPIIPEINFKDLDKLDNIKIINEIKKKGCVIVRDVFDDNQIQEWNRDIEEYIEKNNYYELQK